jgi:hypothetical protein
MTEHYTRNTEGVTAWCARCQRMTEHRVDHPQGALPGAGRLGPCLDPRHGIPQIFVSAECPNCHEKKAKNTAFCQRCYFALPKTMQAALWRRFGQGFEDAFLAARDFLKGKPLPPKKPDTQGNLF